MSLRKVPHTVRERQQIALTALRYEEFNTGVVTTRCESVEMTRYSRRSFLLVGGCSDALQDKRIHPLSDWGQVAAG
jgi:hypothetical protein